jgi:peptidyl-tRNA hydrolase
MTGSAKGNGSHPWVQVIVVDKAGSHESTILLGAQASVAVRLEADMSLRRNQEAFEQWLSGPFTKTVRRGSANDLAKVKAWATENAIPHVAVREGDSAALALLPMRYEDMPKILARLQVAGTELPRVGIESVGDVDSPTSLHVDTSLTTGKATAQAAHAAWGWMLAAVHDGLGFALNQWHADGFPLALHLVAAQGLRDASTEPGAVTVRDNGLTEVAPNTLTAVAVPLAD